MASLTPDMPHRFTNHLIHETSPYLLQHAHNPVDWYPWGEAALQKAQQEDKPILVSIGYAACHWCHVMEKESFEDEETALLMNQYFVNIKIDREERPDLDHIYMEAVQAIAGSGGWPLNVFLTPEKKPFYGGTYFPAVRSYHRPSWKELLLGIAKSFTEQRAEVEAQAEKLTLHLQQSNQFGMENKLSSRVPMDELFTPAQAHVICQNILAQADKQEGGFGNAPKFPTTFAIKYLLRYHHYTGDQAALAQALLSLDKMLMGGIYDQLGGGFSRYATDNHWLVPHFEKMLYDNALLVEVLCEAFQLSRKPAYEQVIRQTLAYIKREMTAPEGGFYAAQDADSEGVEGKYYVWSRQEIENILGAEAGLFCEYYDVSAAGNWEGKNILHCTAPLENFAQQRGMTVTTLKAYLEAARQKLLAVRLKRVKPLLDDKILLGWNALMNSAYCKAYAALGDDDYRQTAVKNFDFLWQRMRREDGILWHSYKAGTAKYPAFLDDYAYLIQALIYLQEITADQNYLLLARQLTEETIAQFQDPSSGYFYFTAASQQDVLVRKKEVYDGAVPSGNAVMAQNLHYLSIVFDNREYEEMALRLTRQIGQTAVRYPTSFGAWCNQLLAWVMGPKEIAIVGKEYKTYLKDLLSLYLPYRVLMASEADDDRFPLLKQRHQPARTLIYLCKGYSCMQPVDNLKFFYEMVKKM